MMNVEQVEDHSEIYFDAEKAGVDNKGKTKICPDEKWENHVKDALATSFIGSVDGINPVKSSTSVTSNNLNSSNSDLSYHNKDEDCDDYDDGDYEDDGSDYGYNDDFPYEDDYLTVQSQFDNIPPNVEASVPWLKEAAPVAGITSTPGSLSIQGSESKNAVTSDTFDNKEAPASTSRLTVPTEPGSHGIGVLQSFKQFDIVDDASDHHYNNVTGEKQPKEWAKRIQEEWKILENDLPETIVVRVYEDRMDLLRAIIIGPSGTPYHDGLFVFDCLFPPKYPDEPPMIYYYSGGLRLNPNLYDCGKVCLSLLGTWPGSETENWVPRQSTMLQVLVSIQGLILNAKPFFNEPGFEERYHGADADMRSKRYNENAFIYSLKTMIYTLRRPPKHFEEFVMGHFKNRAHDILVACKAYAEGATVGSVVIKNGVPKSEKMEKSCSEFKGMVRKVMNVLVREFLRFGFADCKEFQT